MKRTKHEYITDKKTAIKNIKLKGISLIRVATELRNDIDVIMEAIKRNGTDLQYVPDNFRDNFELAMTAVKQNGFALDMYQVIYKIIKILL